MNEQRPSLHRLTMLSEDPAEAWLPADARRWLRVLFFAMWPLLFFACIAIWTLLATTLNRFFWLYDWLLWSAYTFAMAANLVAVGWTRLFLRRVRASMTLSTVRRAADAQAQAIDDWSRLTDEPDGRIVSLVGWVRGRGHLPFPLDGRPCVGLALGCRTRIKEYRIGGTSYGWYQGFFRRFSMVYTFEQAYDGVMESVNDFDLVDTEGRTIPIQVAGGRLIARSNTSILASDVQGQMLVSSLDLPVSVEPLGWDALALHEGDPVMVVGFKTTMVDPTQPGARGAPARVTVASAGPRPLLVYPIPPDADLAPSAG